MLRITVALLLLLAATGAGQPVPASAGAIQAFTVQGVRREALVFSNAQPAPEAGPPLVFVFHGHGGTARGSAERFRVHTLWPQAVVAYMQGLPGVQGVGDPEATRPGWQKSPGELGDRDVQFTDVALAALQKQRKTDPDRVYALGHSNGARFANVLWSMRAEKFAAFCSSSAQGGRLIQTAIPKPVFMIAGKQDTVAPFAGQMRSIDLARRVLQTDPTTATTEGYARFERGINGTELVTYVHPGGHEFPQEALPMVISFFQRQRR